jgi:hypothetical protein
MEGEGVQSSYISHILFLFPWVPPGGLGGLLLLGVSCLPWVRPAPFPALFRPAFLSPPLGAGGFSLGPGSSSPGGAPERSEGAPEGFNQLYITLINLYPPAEPGVLCRRINLM